MIISYVQILKKNHYLLKLYNNNASVFYLYIFNLIILLFLIANNLKFIKIIKNPILIDLIYKNENLNGASSFGFISSFE
jgi:hypothetical protein